MAKGKFIVIEGIDGSGKTTQVAMTKDVFEKKGVKAHLTRECSDGPIGELLRYTYLAGRRQVDERLINILYAADRIDHLTNNLDGVLKFIDNGTHVICDRYYMSSMAYYAMEFLGTADYRREMEYILNLNKIPQELIKPDLTIFLRVNPEAALRRLNDSREDASVYEDNEKLHKIAIAYEDSVRMLTERGENIITIDGTRDVTEIHKDIMGCISIFIPEVGDDK